MIDNIYIYILATCIILLHLLNQSTSDLSPIAAATTAANAFILHLYAVYATIAYTRKYKQTTFVDRHLSVETKHRIQMLTHTQRERKRE